jgi:hypothetical protein
VRLSSWLGLGLGLFYLVAGFAYAATSEFVDGFPLLMAAAVGISVLGGYVYFAVRRAERQVAAGDEFEEELEPHIGSTIWPFGYAVSAIGFVLGLLVSDSFYALGGLGFGAATAGWFADVRRQWLHAEEEPPDPGPPLGPDTTPMVGEGIL